MQNLLGFSIGQAHADHRRKAGRGLTLPGVKCNQAIHSALTYFAVKIQFAFPTLANTPLIKSRLIAFIVAKHARFFYQDKFSSAFELPSSIRCLRFLETSVATMCDFILSLHQPTKMIQPSCTTLAHSQ